MSYFSLTLLFTLCACFVDYAFVIVVIKESYYYYYYYEPVSTRVRLAAPGFHAENRPSSPDATVDVRPVPTHVAIRVSLHGPRWTHAFPSVMILPQASTGNLVWLGSRVVSVLDSDAEGLGFKSQPRRCRVTVLGKLFTPVVPLFTKQRNW